MPENKSEWSESQRNLALHIAALQREVLGKKTEAVPEEKPAEEKLEDERLREGKRFFWMGRWESALREFQLVDTGKIDAQEQAELAYYLGLCYTKLERYNEAVMYLEQVVIASNDPLRVCQCRITLALIYIRTNRAKMAELELRRLINAGFESAPIYNAMAYAVYVQKRYRMALNYYEKTLEIDIDNATAMNSMGFILVDKGFDTVKGLMLCRKAVAIRPQNAAYMDSLGWAYYRSGDVANARKWLQKAMDSAPKEDEIREHFRVVTGGAV